MYLTKTKFARSAVVATLLVAPLLSTPVFAGSDEAALANNERAAQNSIAYSPVYDGYVQSGSADAALVYNEDAAQHAIANTPVDSDFANFSTDPVSTAKNEATLMHNELSAQHAIVDVEPASRFSDARRSSAALNSSTSSESAAPR